MRVTPGAEFHLRAPLPGHGAAVRPPGRRESRVGRHLSSPAPSERETAVSLSKLEKLLLSSSAPLGKPQKLKEKNTLEREN